jgi:hypothetical protein
MTEKGGQKAWDQGDSDERTSMGQSLDTLQKGDTCINDHKFKHYTIFDPTL